VYNKSSRQGVDNNTNLKETTMNAQDFTFGIEIETTFPQSEGLRVGAHGRGVQVPWLPEGWLADADPSIRATGSRRGVEFVSPVLKGAEGLRQAVEAVKEIKSRGGQVNSSCGMHVHVGFDKRDTKTLRRLIDTVANFEKAIFATTGTKNRELGIGSRFSTCWCKSLKQYGSRQAFERRGSRDRYHALNIATSKPTVEFRVFGATLNPEKLAAYVRMVVGICQKATNSKRSTGFHKTASSTRNRSRFTGGEGHAELVRMMYALGWRKNGASTAKMVGDIEGEGVPGMDTTKKELKRLAKKYDAQS